MPALLGQQRCPHCGEKFRALKPPAMARRDCRCGKRWTVTFETVDGPLAERLGQQAYRLRVEPYVDGRRRRVDPAPSLFDADALDEPAVVDAPARRARRSVKRGTHYRR